MHKRITAHLPALAVGLMCVLLAGCNDPCKDIRCVNGTCSDGECDCASGYSGTNCGNPVNARFSGVFVSTENCLIQGDVNPYNVTLEPSTDNPLEFTILGLWQASRNRIIASIDGNETSFTIDRQAIMAGYEAEAAVGTISSDGKTVNLNYQIYRTGQTTVEDRCTAMMQK
ncbi:MAG: hypothetical protein RLZZ165_1243 [Bacteroidota bacterium]